MTLFGLAIPTSSWMKLRIFQTSLSVSVPMCMHVSQNVHKYESFWAGIPVVCLQIICLLITECHLKILSLGDGI